MDFWTSLLISSLSLAISTALGPPGHTSPFARISDSPLAFEPSSVLKGKTSRAVRYRRVHRGIYWRVGDKLAPSDQMVTRTRRRLLMAARALRDRGVLPPGVEDSEVYRGARSGYFISDDRSPWREVYSKQLAASARPQALSHVAEQ
jgi:hypothetical protein